MNKILSILVVFVIIVMGFFIYTTFMGPSVTEEKTVDDGYEEIISLFEKNDVNYQNAKSLKFVYLDDDEKKVVWGDGKEKVSDLKKDLQDFYTNVPGFEGNDANQLKAISMLYLDVIDFSFREETRLKELNSLMQNISCDNQVMQDINKLFSDRYLDIYSVQLEADEFFYNFPTYFDPLEIDLDEEYNDWLLSQKVISDFEINCEEIA
jgi:subtilisin family serine protease